MAIQQPPGETLDAIQQLTNYAVNRGRTHRVRIHIDAEHYRAKREESLWPCGLDKRLANKVAAKVVKYRRNVTLEPMNAYERHVIHGPCCVTYRDFQHCTSRRHHLDSAHRAQPFRWWTPSGRPPPTSPVCQNGFEPEQVRRMTSVYGQLEPVLSHDDLYGRGPGLDGGG